jgi:SOS response regulatory protein OraA/RecX
MLARRELSVAQTRARLIDRDHDRAEVETAIEHLIETGALDDRRVARAYARTALKVKGRGRLRIQSELHAMGIARDVAAEALAETFGDVDERSLIAKAIQKKLRGHQNVATQADYARLYQFLIRQGFSPAATSAALRAYRKGRVDEDT